MVDMLRSWRNSQLRSRLCLSAKARGHPPGYGNARMLHSYASYEILACSILPRSSSSSYMLSAKLLYLACKKGALPSSPELSPPGPGLDVRHACTAVLSLIWCLLCQPLPVPPWPISPPIKKRKYRHNIRGWHGGTAGSPRVPPLLRILDVRPAPQRPRGGPVRKRFQLLYRMLL